MDRQTQEYLDSLLNISPDNLTEEEKAFIRARRSYLNPMQTQFYAEILGITKETTVLEDLHKTTETVEAEVTTASVEIETVEVEPEHADNGLMPGNVVSELDEPIKVVKKKPTTKKK